MCRIHISKLDKNILVSILAVGSKSKHCTKVAIRINKATPPKENFPYSIPISISVKLY